MNDIEDLRGSVADELRNVADELESGELKLTEHPRITHIGFEYGEPPEVAFTYWSDRVRCERTVEIY